MEKRDPPPAFILALTKLVPGLSIIFVTSIVLHLLFSSLGFNLTDDGFILAGSKRVLERQIPYKDFIAIRPPGSYFLHTIDLALGKDYSFYFSRFGAWLEFTAISLLWIKILTKSLKLSIHQSSEVSLALISLVFNVNAFPIMAWHTVDGLFFASLGIFLSLKSERKWRAIGAFLIGMSPLFKQNFLAMIPVFIFLMKLYSWTPHPSPADYLVYLFSSFSKDFQRLIHLRNRLPDSWSCCDLSCSRPSWIQKLD